MSRRSYAADIASLLLVALIYFGAGKLGLSLAFFQKSASPVWPPTGLSLAAMLLLGYRVWPAVFVGAFLVNRTIPSSAGASAVIALGNTVEALAGAFLAKRFARGAAAFDDAADIFRFVFFAALPSTAISAAIGVTTLGLSGEASWLYYWRIFLTWWTGNFASDLVVAPLILIWMRRPTIELSRQRTLEGIALLTLVVATSFMRYTGSLTGPMQHYPIGFLSQPLFIWAAYRFHQRGAITVAAIISLIAIYGTQRGFGPFGLVTVPDVNDRLVLLQMFIAVLSLTGLVLGTVVSEQADSEAALRLHEGQLQIALEDQRRAQKDRDEILERERAARADAERASVAKDQFLAVLSHELRTPLTPALLTAGMLEQDPSVPAHVREDVQTIRRNIELEARLIDDLLDLTRIARGKLQLELRPTDLHGVIRRAVEICAASAPMKIHIELAAARHFVSGDAARLQQVFWNLISNAVKFTPPDGRITVRTFDDGPGRPVVAQVIDTGDGIEPELLPKLFNAFEQGESVKERKIGGLGLGLAISKALIAAHGGSVVAQSEGIGRGTTFTVEMPTILQSTDDKRGKTTAACASVPPAGTERPLRILLVEDHENTLAVMSRLLSQQRHLVTTATTVQGAIRAAEQASFDLVISDLGLPDGLGYELMRAVRDRFGTCGIAISGYGMDADIQKSAQAGFVEHLTKPVDLETLNAAIARAAMQLR